MKDKYHPKIKEYKKEIDTHNYHLEQNESKQEQAKLALSDLQRKATSTKQNDLTVIEDEIAEATELELKAKEAVLKIETEISKLEREKERERDKKIVDEKLKSDSLVNKIELEITQSNSKFSEKHAEIKKQQYAELTNLGADTQRITEIENEIVVVKSELQFIDGHNGLIERYKYDKIELLDRVDEFKAQQKILEKNLTIDEEKQQLQKDKQQKDLIDITGSLHSLNQKIGEYTADANEFDSFSKTEIYLDIPIDFKEPKEENKSDKSCSKLISEINQTVYSLNERQNKLKEEVTQFTGSFSVDNIFKFKLNFSKTDEYLQFAEELNEFIEENKIERFEKDVHERFAYIIHSIGKETGNLMSKGGDILKTITKINNDFTDRNFVLAIKKIELRWVKSSNKIVSLLVDIQDFNNENQFLGINSLFASQDIDKKNKNAISLLKELLKSMTESKRDKINLSDSFELQFRIIENQNDTGWVEKLANVGSDGTDILVKAMINIMLLNVSKGESSKQFKDFKLHCMMDEIGKLHSNNVKGILKFANERNILLINGSPEESNALGYKHIYQLYKDEKSFTKVKRLITNFKQE